MNRGVTSAKIMQALLLVNDSNLVGCRDASMLLRWKSEVKNDMGNALTFLTQASVSNMLENNVGLCHEILVGMKSTKVGVPLL